MLLHHKCCCFTHPNWDFYNLDIFFFFSEMLVLINTELEKSNEVKIHGIQYL